MGCVLGCNCRSKNFISYRGLDEGSKGNECLRSEGDMMMNEAVPNKTHHIEPNRIVDNRDSSYTARARKTNMAAVLATDSIASDPCTCCAVKRLLGWATVGWISL